MNANIEIAKPRIKIPLIYFVSLTIYFLIACVAFSLDNIFLKISVPVSLLLITTLYFDKVFFTKKIGKLILHDQSVEIVIKDYTESIELKYLTQVYIREALINPFGRRELSKCPILLLTLYCGNKHNKIYLCNNKTSFKLIDEYLKKLNRMGINLQ